MVRESKAAREKRIALEQEAERLAQMEWHKGGPRVWRRRAGMWWLVVSRTTKPYSSTAYNWMAFLHYGYNDTPMSMITCSKPLGAAESTVPGAQVLAAADAWLVEVTGDLRCLIERHAAEAPGEAPQNGSDNTKQEE